VEVVWIEGGYSKPWRVAKQLDPKNCRKIDWKNVVPKSGVPVYGIPVCGVPVYGVPHCLYDVLSLGIHNFLELPMLLCYL